MYAVEFETSIHDGIVKIPESFRKVQSLLKAKVIIMVEDDTLLNHEMLGSFDDLFAAPAGAFASAQAIDQFIREERAAWDK